MRVYSEGGEEDPRLTHEEYLKRVAEKICPPMIGKIEGILAGTEVGALAPKDITIEQVTSMKEPMYWKIIFQTNLLVIEFTCRANLSMKIIYNRSLIVRNPLGEASLLYLFDKPGQRVMSVTSIKEGPEKYRRFQKDVQNPFQPKIGQTQPINHQVMFQPGNNPIIWRCTCWIGKEGWCTHVQSYWDMETDARDLDGLKKSIGFDAKYVRYYVGSGDFAVDLTLMPVNPVEIGFDEGEPTMYRLSYGNHLSMWLDEGTSGMALVRQLVDMVKASDRYGKFSWWAVNDMSSVSKCSNRFHAPRDSKAFTDTVKLRASAPERIDDFVLANAFSDYFTGRCIPCQAVLKSMENDVPSITGPATRTNPF
jgi:hypothetical protein